MWRNRRRSDDFIPIDLRNDLQEDAESADARGDSTAARILRLMAAYTGGDAPGHARSLGVEAFEARYPSARGLMELVRWAEAQTKTLPVGVHEQRSMSRDGGI